MPLDTVRAESDYGFAEAATTHDVIGVKVWIFKGESVSKVDKPVQEEAETKTAA